MLGLVDIRRHEAFRGCFQRNAKKRSGQQVYGGQVTAGCRDSLGAERVARGRESGFQHAPTAPLFMVFHKEHAAWSATTSAAASSYASGFGAARKRQRQYLQGFSYRTEIEEKSKTLPTPE